MSSRKRRSRLVSSMMLASTSLSLLAPLLQPSIVGADTTTSSTSTVPSSAANAGGTTGIDDNSTSSTTAQATSYTVASFGNYPTKLTTTAGDTFFGATDGQNKASAQVTSSGGENLVTDAGGAVGTTKWDTKNSPNGKFWVFALSTTGYQNLQLSSQQYGSSTGPRDYKIQYSTDYNPTDYNPTDPTSGNWTDVDGGTVKVNAKPTDENTTPLTGIVSNLDLPESLDNQGQIFIRYIMTDSTSIGNGTIGSSGSDYINNVNITGTKYYGKDDAKADIDDGTSIPKGQTVNLSTDDPTATIHYSLNGGDDITAADKTKAAVTINDFSGNNGAAQLTAYTVDANGNQSAPITYNYYEKQLSPVTASQNSGTAIKDSTAIKLTEADNANATIKYTVTTKSGTADAKTSDEQTYDPSKPLTFSKDDFPVEVSASATDDNYKASDPAIFDYTLNDVDASQLKPYFGNLHSHTTYSDGIGVPSDAFASAKAAGLDFYAVTDHSNYFENANTTSADAEVTDQSPSFAPNMNSAKLPDGQTNTFDAEFAASKAATDLNPTDGSKPFLALTGFEMTWASGPGHINTFNMTDSNGNNAFVSRQNSWYNNKTGDIGLQRYYDTLAADPASISMFNHPGPTFGNFDDFSYWTPQRDSAMDLLEVGDGEDKVDGAGYFPSYDQYFLALDKGWHVAPTDDQDNHHGKWGSANSARDVALATGLTQDDIYDAMKNRRMYSSEDPDARLSYTLNGEVMGTIMDSKPDTVNISAELNDPTGDGDNHKPGTPDAISKIELKGEGGKVIDSYTPAAGTTDAKYTYTGADTSAYYVIEATEADGDIIISAPIWTGTVEKVGLDSLSMAENLGIKGQPLTLQSSLYNNETSDFDINKITYKVGDKVIGEDDDAQVVTGGSTKALVQKWSPDTAGAQTVTEVVDGTLNGVAKEYTQTLNLDIKDPSSVAKIGIDGLHNNDYATEATYPNEFGNFAKIAATDNATVTIVAPNSQAAAAVTTDTSAQTDATTDTDATVTATTAPAITKELLDQYSAFIISAPQVKAASKDASTGGAQTDFTFKPYTAAEIEAIKEWAAEPGKTLILMGTSDYGGSATNIQQTAAYQLNQIAQAVGSHVHFGDDEEIDDAVHGNVDYRLSFSGNDFNLTDPLMQGVDPKQNYSFYSGDSLTIDDDGGATHATALVNTHTAADAPKNTTVAQKNVWGYITGSDGKELKTSAGKGTTDATTVADPTQLVNVPYTGTTSEDSNDNGLAAYQESNDAVTDGKYDDEAAQGGSPALVKESLNDASGKATGSTLITAGTSFLSDFEIQSADFDPQAGLQSANATIASNIAASISPKKITGISDVENSGVQGETYTIKGTLTSNSSDYNQANNLGTKDALAEGSTYMKDDTGSINIFPLHDTKAQAGAQIEVTGSLTSYYGEKELDITSETVDNSTITPVTPETVTPGVAESNASISKYITTQGKVSNVVAESDGTIDSFTLTGADGGVPVEINDTSNVDLSFVKNGATVSVTGFGSRFITGGKPGDNIDWGDTSSNLNVRVADRSLIKEVTDEGTGTSSSSSSSEKSSTSSSSKETSVSSSTAKESSTTERSSSSKTSQSSTMKQSSSSKNTTKASSKSSISKSTTKQSSKASVKTTNKSSKTPVKSKTTTAKQAAKVVKYELVHNLYNPNSGEHFFTIDNNEVKALLKAGWRNDGTVGTAVTAKSKGAEAVYRLYNPNSGQHFYTTSSYEKNSLKKAGWHDEGIGYYALNKSASQTAVYRVYNPNSGEHYFTTSNYEKSALVKLGWKFEEISWYIAK